MSSAEHEACLRTAMTLLPRCLSRPPFRQGPTLAEAFAVEASATCRWGLTVQPPLWTSFSARGAWIETVMQGISVMQGGRRLRALIHPQPVTQSNGKVVYSLPLR
jgi:hypothetical protein